MTFLEQFKVSDTLVKFWSGFDLELILNHPKDGTSGYMVVLVESIKMEYLRYSRNLKIDQICSDKRERDFYKIIENIENDYVLIYQSRGEQNVILVDIIKDKFSKSQIW
jgi:hypothetical protein